MNAAQSEPSPTSLSEREAPHAAVKTQVSPQLIDFATALLEASRYEGTLPDLSRIEWRCTPGAGSPDGTVDKHDGPDA